MIEATVGKNKIGGFEVLDMEPVDNNKRHADVSFYIENEYSRVYFRVTEIYTCVEDHMKSKFAIIQAKSNDGLKIFNGSNDVLDYLKIEKQEDRIFYVESEKAGEKIARRKCLEYYGEYNPRQEESDKTNTTTGEMQ